MRVHVVAVPYDSARRGERMGAGPEHLLGAGLVARLAAAGHEAHVQLIAAPADSWRAEIRTAFELARGVAAAVHEAGANGAFPLVLSGNCGPAALGSVAGLAAPAVVLWFDAHGDFNTPETTVGGFLDGMALAALTGRCWTQLSAALPGFRAVPEDSVALIGARDLDPLEAAALDASAVRRLDPGQVRAKLPAVLAALGDAAPAAYLHLDLDVLDPSEGRVNPYAAPGGLSRRDVEWAMAAIGKSLPLRAGSLTALDPASDVTGEACEAALRLAVALVNAAAR